MMVTAKPTFQKTCYCPGTKSRFSEEDNLRLWNWGGGSFRVLGYALTLHNTGGLVRTNWNRTINPKPVRFGPIFIQPEPITERVLTADATISMPGQRDPRQKLTGGYNYSEITGGSYWIPHMSAHLKKRVPSGGNLGMLDGHVEWRNFQLMTVRGYGGAGGGQDNGTCPTFWW